jgi:hypothetical protein
LHANIVELWQDVLLRHLDAREDEQQHRDADSAYVRLDAECLTQQIAEEDSQQMARCQQCGSVDDKVS